MDEDTITRIYCDVDDYCKALEAYCKAHSLPRAQKNSWFPAGRLSLSEVMTIILLFHTGFPFGLYCEASGIIPRSLLRFKA
jgi:hypothetical protein